MFRGIIAVGVLLCVASSFGSAPEEKKGFGEGVRTEVKSCGHAFHKGCIRLALGVKDECPNCRRFVRWGCKSRRGAKTNLAYRDGEICSICRCEIKPRNPR